MIPIVQFKERIFTFNIEFKDFSFTVARIFRAFLCLIKKKSGIASTFAQTSLRIYLLTYPPPPTYVKYLNNPFKLKKCKLTKKVETFLKTYLIGEHFLSYLCICLCTVQYTPVHSVHVSVSSDPHNQQPSSNIELWKGQKNIQISKLV